MVADQIVDATASLLQDYQDNLQNGESFYEYYQRQGTDHFQAVLTHYFDQLKPEEIAK
ncbi:hypothetical protein [Secundilactobacillus similis]|uniref:hypothetical protein n=1 Tax=Secundilactobacillus similis TaxID=414682 RepID=UPI000A48A757|nr:hypothetical protein [Secundilactobacillus similis]